MEEHLILHNNLSVMLLRDQGETGRVLQEQGETKRELQVYSRKRRGTTDQ